MSDSDIESENEDKPATKKRKTSKSGQKVTSKGQLKKLKKVQDSEEEGLNSNVKKKTKAKRLKEQSESVGKGKKKDSPIFEEGFDDNNNNNDTPMNNSTKKIKKARRRRKKVKETVHQDSGANTKKSDVKEVESNKSSKASSEDTPVQADIVVPSRKGKLKDVVQQSLMEKPTLKVVEKEEEISPGNSGELDLAKTMAKILNSSGSDDAMEFVLSGGFVDSDDDAEKAAKKKLKKEKKQKRKSLPAKLPSQENAGENSASEKETKMSNSFSPENTTKSKRAAKKLKRKSTGSIRDAKDSTVNCSPSSEKKNSANKKGAVLENGMEEGEIEILIPNKKCKGKYKEAFQKEIEKSMAKEEVNLNTLSEQSVGSNSNSTKPFASFEKVLKTPPAFVRKAVSKATSSGKKSSQKVRNAG